MRSLLHLPALAPDGALPALPPGSAGTWLDVGADGYVLGPEPVPDALAQEARQRGAALLVRLDGTGPDAAATLLDRGGRPDGVIAPGIVGAADVQRLGAALAVVEAERGWPDGGLSILACGSDTAAGVLALASLTGASRRLRALVWDAEALAADLGLGPAGGVSRPDPPPPLREAMAWTLLAGRSARVPVYATLPRIVDAGAGLARAALGRAARTAFFGALSADPALVSAINRAFPRPVRPGSAAS